MIAGQVYPFTYHQNYFDREIALRLSRDSDVHFIDTPSFAGENLDLLRHARALLLTSTVEETSSLVAMEAMACGTPVVAFRRGAFPEIIADRETGFVVESVADMVAVLGSLDQISPEACRRRVGRHFTASRMAQGYQEDVPASAGLYRQNGSVSRRQTSRESMSAMGILCQFEIANRVAPRASGSIRPWNPLLALWGFFASYRSATLALFPQAFGFPLRIHVENAPRTWLDDVSSALAHVRSTTAAWRHLSIHEQSFWVVKPTTCQNIHPFHVTRELCTFFV